MHILLTGNGKMAAALESACNTLKMKVTKLGEDFDYSNEEYGRPIAIHFGSGRQLRELIGTCERLKMPLIQGSTKLTVAIPPNKKVAIVNAPNLSLPMVRFLAAFPDFAKAIKPGMVTTVLESHQKPKPDKSGTARNIAELLGISEPEIEWVRKPVVQLALGVPREHLDAHAYHRFSFQGQGVEIVVSTKIHGRATYAEGAIVLAQAIVCQVDPLKNGVHELKDILHLLPTP